MVVLTPCATNLNQTSSSGVPLHEFALIPELVADKTVPPVFVQVVADVKRIALTQLSFDGCAKEILRVIVNTNNRSVVRLRADNMVFLVDFKNPNLTILFFYSKVITLNCCR